MPQFENKYYFFGLLLVPVLIFFYFLLSRWRKRTLKAYADMNLVNQLAPNISKGKRIWKTILILLSFTLILIGIVNPQVGTTLEDVKRTGADIMICLDVSNSMKAEDLAPNRLEKAKQAISKLIDKLEGDRIGLIVFAGQAYVQLPITTDYAAAKMFLESINTDMISTQGTAIGTAIELATESFGKDEGKNKAIIVITDGENHEDDAISATENAVEKNITIHTIGMGSKEGVPIPIYSIQNNLIANGSGKSYRKDKDGNTVVTKLNEEMLREIATAGNGVYVKASNSDAGLKNVLDEIDKLEKKQFESKRFKDYEDRFQWFIAPALLIIIIEFLITERRSKLFQKLNLFNEKKN